MIAFFSCSPLPCAHRWARCGCEWVYVYDTLVSPSGHANTLKVEATHDGSHAQSHLHHPDNSRTMLLLWEALARRSPFVVLSLSVIQEPCHCVLWYCGVYAPVPALVREGSLIFDCHPAARRAKPAHGPWAVGRCTCSSWFYST